jgi:hypothetical protein
MLKGKGGGGTNWFALSITNVLIILHDGSMAEV